ncbi:MAG: DUF6452 family protein [Bacteroidota bacterium]
MRRLFPILFLGLWIFPYSACEKDDICVEGDTPLLVIGFFDVEDTITPKAVPSLRITLPDLENTLVNTFSDRSSTLDSIGIPLNTQTTSTRFTFITNSADDAEMVETGNQDILDFTYTTRERFVSRACGFVANYADLDTVRTVNAEEDWIKRITIVDTLIERSNGIHVKIFH